MNKLEIEHKEEYWEFLRGISIIFVVLSHCCVPNVIMNGQLKLSAISLWYCLEVNLISTAVSIFFFISGYWGIKSFLRTKIKKEYYKKD